MADSDTTPRPRCENEWACSKSTLLWQGIHCKCLIEAKAVDTAAAWIADDRDDDTYSPKRLEVP